jgi:PPK2 family polyphosphate:nucleotide phosphotransferase
MKKEAIQLKEIATRAPEHLSKKEIVKKTNALSKEIADFQELLFANKNQGVLIVLQGMDSSGKDSTTSTVFKYSSPAGVHAFSFRKPTEKEFAHDFLWRCHKLTPAKGKIHVFIRSHYEDILIQRVHKWIDMKHVEKRMKAINAFEELITFDANTIVLKFYLHLSYERQAEKLQERIDRPDKHWKHNAGDWEERKHWESYMQAYEYAINESIIPWHIIPADNSWYRKYLVTKIVHERLAALNMTFPPLKND